MAESEVVFSVEEQYRALLQRCLRYMKVVSNNDINAYSDNNPCLYEEMWEDA